MYVSPVDRDNGFKPDAWLKSRKITFVPADLPNWRELPVVGLTGFRPPIPVIR